MEKKRLKVTTDVRGADGKLPRARYIHPRKKKKKIRNIRAEEPQHHQTLGGKVVVVSVIIIAGLKITIIARAPKENFAKFTYINARDAISRRTTMS